jgi:hypothetical protein
VKTPTIEIDIDKVLGKSGAAFRVMSQGKVFWLPKSQLEALNVAALEEAHGNRTALCCLQIPKWLADKKQLKGL